MITELDNNLFKERSPVELDYKIVSTNIPFSRSSNKNRTVGTGYTFDKQTGNFTLTNYVSNVTFTQEHVGSYMCSINSHECGPNAPVFKITEIVGTNTTKVEKLFKIADNVDLTTTGLYKAEDDYGTSYYFRGSKEHLNNNLIFANHQWKIVRINGDDSIRIIYNGKCPNNKCKINNVEPDIKMGDDFFSIAGNDNKYAGYMYGVTSPDYNETHANQNDSVVKMFLDSWYENNILGEYENYLSDTLFCGDRELRSNVGGAATGTGTENSVIVYASVHRLITIKIPSLKCPLKNDAYTVSDTTYGSGALTYPIAMLSVDEIAFAGLISSGFVTGNYLYDSTGFWTITPREFTSIDIQNWYAFPEGNFLGYPASYPGSVRAVLNLKPNTIVKGSGSIKDPFVVI